MAASGRLPLQRQGDADGPRDCAGVSGSRGCFGCQYIAEDRRNVAAKLRWILAHWEMAELLHDGDVGTGDRGGRPHRIFRRTGKIILTGQQVERTLPGIDLLDAAAEVAIP